MNPLDVLLLNAAATSALVGLVRNVQLVQYSSFARVEPRENGVRALITLRLAIPS